MKTEFRVSAKTVGEAYTKAIELYSSLGEISYEVITEGKKGFLGLLGRVDAVIKVTVDDGRPERKPEDKKVKNQTQGGQKTPEKQKNDQKNQKASAPFKNNNQPKQKTQAQDTKAESKPVKAEPKSEAPKAEVTKAENTKETSNEASKELSKEEIINVTVEEKTLAMNFLKSFIKDIGMECEVKGDMTLSEDGFVSRLITIEGEGATSLIGHRGDMLDALQYLANLCLARKSQGDHKEYVKVVIDIENYREKREQSLRGLARRMAEKALKFQRNVTLEPMNPYERMIIHSEVQGIEGVTTRSVGYDDNRKVVIACENKKKR